MRASAEVSRSAKSEMNRGYRSHRRQFSPQLFRARLHPCDRSDSAIAPSQSQSSQNSPLDVRSSPYIGTNWPQVPSAMYKGMSRQEKRRSLSSQRFPQAKILRNVAGRVRHQRLYGAHHHLFQIMADYKRIEGFLDTVLIFCYCSRATRQYLVEKFTFVPG
jgi:hypothetical protein